MPGQLCRTLDDAAAPHSIGRCQRRIPRASGRHFGPLEQKALFAALVDVFAPTPAQIAALLDTRGPRSSGAFRVLAAAS